MVALSALGSFLLAANLTSLDRTTVHSSANDLKNTIFAVRADLVGGRFASAEPIDNVTFELADPASTVYISYESFAQALEATKPAGGIRDFVSALLFFEGHMQHTCTATVRGPTAVNASVELHFSDKTTMTKQLESKPNAMLSTLAELETRSVDRLVFRVESGCLDFATLQCNLASTGVSLRLGFTRAEYAELNPRSGMEQCSENFRPFDLDPSMNVAFTVPTTSWGQLTVSADASSFFNYKPPTTTTPTPTTVPSNTTELPATTVPVATSATTLLSLSVSVITGLGMLFLVL